MSEQGLVVREEVAGALAEFGLVNVAREVAKREQFHAFIKQVLKEGTHFGKVPGVDKNFLWQPGAEEIFSAFGCRPEYTIEDRQIDPRDPEGAFILTRCRAIHVASGVVAGEGHGFSSADDFRETHRKGANRCPWDNEHRRYACTEKGKHGELPSFNVLAHNMLMRANKRAFVATARTLGCASEMFTQDEDMVVTRDEEAEEAKEAKEAKASQRRQAVERGQKAMKETAASRAEAAMAAPPGAGQGDTLPDWLIQLRDAVVSRGMTMQALASVVGAPVTPRTLKAWAAENVKPGENPARAVLAAYDALAGSGVIDPETGEIVEGAAEDEGIAEDLPFDD